MKLDVAIIGLLNIDMIIQGSAPSKIDELRFWAGESEIECLTAGAIGYFTQNLAKLGLRTGVIATIADDSFGLGIHKTLSDLGVDLSILRIQKNTKSAIGVFMLLFGSKKRPLTYRLMTHDLIPQFTEEDMEYIYNSRLLHIGGYLHFPQKKVFEEIIRNAVEQGVKISIDTQFPLKPLEKPWLNALPDCLDLVDIMFMDENEAFGLTNTPTIEAAATQLLDLGIKIVAMKLGAKGCYVCDQNEQLRKPATEVENIIDSIGAGDSFDCGFVTGFLEGLSLEKMTDLALIVAGHSLRGVGGSSTIPPRTKIIL